MGEREGRIMSRLETAIEEAFGGACYVIVAFMIGAAIYALWFYVLVAVATFGLLAVWAWLWSGSIGPGEHI